MIDYDSLINGGQYVPADMVSAVDQSTETMPTAGRGLGVTGNGAVAGRPRASTQTILLVWLILLVLLVVAHVVTLSLQR